jgi:hypothetical protein
MNEIYKEAIETIEENLISVFGNIFEQKHKEKIDCIFAELEEKPKVSDMLTELMCEIEWTFYKYGRATEKLLGELE